MLAALVIIQPIDANQKQTISAENIDGNSLTISRLNSEQWMYLINDKVYTWDDLTPQQQQALTQLHSKLESVKNRLRAATANLQPVEFEIEVVSNLETMAIAAETIAESTLIQESHALPELEAQYSARKAARLALESAMKEKEQAMLRLEKPMRQFEDHIEAQLKPFETELNGYLKDVIYVINNP